MPPADLAMNNLQGFSIYLRTMYAAAVGDHCFAWPRTLSTWSRDSLIEDWTDSNKDAKSIL